MSFRTRAIWRRGAGPAAAGSTERGFTLLETLVALVIAGLGFAILLHAAESALATARGASTYQTATVLARSRLTLIGSILAGAERDEQGRDGRFTWHLHIAPEQIEAASMSVAERAVQQAQDRAALYTVAIDVAWTADGTRRALHLETRRLGFLPPTPEQP
jgi:prepilin-type N-terminal cleavage/methylation domain-containing protein